MAQRESEMSQVFDFNAFKASIGSRAETAPKPANGTKDVDWLAEITKNKLAKNLIKIANLVGRRAIEPFDDKSAIPAIYTSVDDVKPYGTITVFTDRGRRVKTVNVCVTNNLALLFGAVSRRAGDDENAGHVAGLFTAGVIVAAGAIQTISPVNKFSADAELWRSVEFGDQPLTTEYFRFAGGVVREIFGDIDWVCLNSGVTPSSPQEAALINPLSLVQMKRTLVPVY